MPSPRTFYSNVVNVKTTPSELVIEFGSVFPEVPLPPGKPITFDPEVRVVLNVSAVKVLSDVLLKANTQMEQEHKTSPQQESLRTTSGQ